MASCLALCALALFAALVSGADESVWGPADGVKALDAVEKAIDRIVAAPNLSAEQLKQAKHVAEDVKKDIEEVESSKTLSKAERQAKVGAALKELMGLKDEFSRPQNKTGLESKLATLQKELSEKKQALEKEESMIKLLNLQKSLAEKKMELQKLLEKKHESDMSKKSTEEEAGEESAMAGKLLTALHGLEAGNSSQLAAPLKVAKGDLQAREKKVSASLEKMEKEEKKSEADLDAAANKHVPSTGKDDTIKKEQSMLRVFKKQVHRKFAKAEALKKDELAELKEAELSIEKRDVKSLQKTLAKMQGQAKVLSAKSGDFLH